MHNGPNTDDEQALDSWKSSFLKKLHEAQSQCANQFEETLDRAVVPVFDDLSSFLSDNGFKISTPLSECGRHSFKYELAENAYLLMIFRFSAVGEFELRTETFVPGAEPLLDRRVGRIADVDADWAQRRFQDGLDRFVDLLAENAVAQPAEELVAV
ncbi:MAG: hypothetical protein ACE5I3_10120 [Phycisphaerae bacterium]